MRVEREEERERHTRLFDMSLFCYCTFDASVIISVSIKWDCRFICIMHSDSRSADAKDDDDDDDNSDQIE